MSLLDLIFGKQEKEKEKTTIKRAWLCIEMISPDGTPYNYREVQLTRGTDITWENKSGFKVHLTLDIRDDDLENLGADAITATVPA